MPVKRLSLRVPDQGVRNRNSKVLRRYEASCRGFEKEYHTAMRGHRAILADDLQFAYYLLKQMERYEDEKLTKKNVVVRCTYKIPPLKINLSRPNSKLVPTGAQTDRPAGNVGKREEDVPSVRPLTAPAGTSLTTKEKKNVVQRISKIKLKNGKKKRGKPTRSQSAPVPSHQEEGEEDEEPVPPTPLARFTRTYEYNRKVLLCRSRQEERRMERIRESEEDYDNQSNYDYDKEEEEEDNYFVIEEEECNETRKHDYWVWKIDVLFEKWRRNDRELDDDDIYSLYEEDLDEEIFDDNQVQSYMKPGIRQVNTQGRTKLVDFTKNKVLKYRWAFAGEGFKQSAEDNRRSRRKFVTAELSHRERQKIRDEAERKCRRLKKMVQESDFLRNEVYLMAPFYKTKQALIAKVAAKQPALFE